jgi:transcriptional regulator with XRE-family HTH domain
MPDPDENATPQEKLRYYRMVSGLSYEELGSRLGMTSFGIINLESGFNDIQYEDAHKLGEALSVDPKEFLDEYSNFCGPGYGKRIASIRHAMGLTQEQLADKMGVLRSTVSIWESEFDNHHPAREMYELLKQYASEHGIDIIQQVENQEKYVDEYERFVAQDWGKKLRRIRLCYGMIPSDFATILGCEEQTLTHWELECSKPLRRYFGTIKKLAADKKINLDSLNKNPDRYTSDFENFIARDCGRKMKSIRMAYDMTQREFSRLIGCCDVAVSKWENGLCTPELKYFRTIEMLARRKKLTIRKLNENPDLCEDNFEIFCSSAYWNIIMMLRKELGLSQKALAEALSVSVSIIGYWEHKKVIPGRASYIALKTYALQKGVDIDDAARKNQISDTSTSE